MKEAKEAAKRLADSCNYGGKYDCEHCPYAEIAEDGMEVVISCSGDYQEDVCLIVDNLLNMEGEQK